MVINSAMIHFHEYVQKHLTIPFEWGVNDCVTFSIGWGEIVRDEEILIQYLPWNNEQEAMDKIEMLGGLAVEFDKLFVRIEPNFANDGDLTVVNGCAMLFSGSKLVAPSHEGLKHLNRMETKCAWRF